MKITANTVTMTRIVLLPLMAGLLYGDHTARLFGLGLLVILGLTDWLDGIMARKEGPSVLGGLLDPIADKIFVAVLYLPLTDLGVVPLWMTIAMLSRDFLVTSLRTSLSLRDAPMRTSTLAKFKTAAQMLCAGYVLLYYTAPHEWWSWAVSIAACFAPGILIPYRLVRRQKQGKRSVILTLVMTAVVLTRWILGPDLATLANLAVATAMTLGSGLSYLVDAWTALRGKSGGWRELSRFCLEGVLLPSVVIGLLAYYSSILATTAIILIVTVDFAVGGLGNLLASKKLTLRFRWMAAKSLTQLGLCSVALLAGAGCLSMPQTTTEIIIAMAGTISLTVGAISFIKHRKVYLEAL